MYKDILKKNGLKNTESRMVILDVLEESEQPMTAEEIFVKTRERHELNFSTVYRTLATLHDKGIVIKNVGADQKAYFQIYKTKHSHYLVCSDCHRRVIIDGCPLEEIGQNLRKKTGFHITGHNLEFIGECPECIRKKKD